MQRGTEASASKTTAALTNVDQVPEKKVPPPAHVLKAKCDQVSRLGPRGSCCHWRWEELLLRIGQKWVTRGLLGHKRHTASTLPPKEDESHTGWPTHVPFPVRPRVRFLALQILESGGLPD